MSKRTEGEYPYLKDVINLAVVIVETALVNVLAVDCKFILYDR